MSVKKMPKEKRNKVILVWLVILVMATAWGFVVLSWQLATKQRASQNLEKRRGQFTTMTNALSRAEQTEIDMGEAQEKLRTFEARMAQGDVFSWVVTTVRGFKQGYNVDLPQFSQVTIGDTTLLPKFPYRQASVTVAGSAYFHDLGMFVADFENQFPFARIVDIDIEPSSNVASSDPEKLNFKLVIIFLVKPSA
jgi:hypothetical protein